MMNSTEQRKPASSKEFTKKLRAFGDTDVGCVRQNNEDNYLILEDKFVFGVADGMGGARAGEVASEMALETIASLAKVGEGPAALYRLEEDEASGDKVLSWVANAVRKSHKKIWKRSQKEVEMRGMGCTLDVLLLASNRAFVGHVGDSRIYLLRRGRAYRVTQDHTLAQAQYTAGFLSEEELKTARTRNILLKAMGVAPEVEADIFTFEIAVGDRFLLCSDGLYEYISDIELAEIFDKIPLENIPRYLIDLACDRGGHDNVTAVVVEVCPQQEIKEETLAKTAEALASVPFLEHFTYPELEILSQAGQLLQCHTGKSVLVSTEEKEQLCIVIEGKLSDGDAGKDFFATEGDVLGEEMLFDSHSKLSSVEATQESLVFLLDREIFFRLSDREPSTISKFLWGIMTYKAEQFRRRALTYARQNRQDT